MKKRAYIYIDGLKFYYGLVKNTPYKWLDFKALFTKILPKDFEILKIKYFTAIVKAFPSDPQAPHRQKIYLEALKKYIPELEIYYGSFLANKRIKKLASPITDYTGKKIEYASVVEPEEKGSDVNLAVHLLNDSWLDYYDWAVVVSNDGDLASALRLVKEQNGKKILLIPTFSKKGKNKMKKPTSRLLEYADDLRYIRVSTLAKCQLPEKIPGTNLHKPPEW
jgi:uncharacterized LabA/DUF88 family protein